VATFVNYVYTLNIT